MAWRLHKFKSPDDCCRNSCPLRSHTPLLCGLSRLPSGERISHSINQNLDADKIQALVQPLSKVEQMKIYVSCDIEGLAGIATFDMEKEDTVLFRELYHQHVAWLIEGIQKSAKMNKLQKLLLPIRIAVD